MSRWKYDVSSEDTSPCDCSSSFFGIGFLRLVFDREACRDNDGGSHPLAECTDLNSSIQYFPVSMNRRMVPFCTHFKQRTLIPRCVTNTRVAMTYTEQHQTELLEGLKAFLRIPSISTLSEHKGDIRRAADFALNELRSAGMTAAELIEGAGNPLVFAESLEAPDKPTILFYGHYDVQPPDPLDEWKSPPFEPEVRGRDIFARGSADDKGQVYLQIKAVEGLLRTTGRLPVNVKFLLEGEEETGGEHIEEYVKTRPPRLKADAAVVCDTEMFAPDLPTICVGLRGLVYYELIVQGADHDLHSGIYGGAAPNPMMAVAEIITALKDRDGHIKIPGF